MSNTKKNLIYNMMYQLLIILQPLIIAPYISRILGSEGLGLYSYTLSITNYFVLFTMLGLENFGNRSISRVRDKKDQLSATFINLYSLQLITGMVSLIAFVILIIFSNNQLIYLMHLFLVLSAIFDINWFFVGMEQFKLIVFRNLFIKILTLIGVIYFVNEASDIWKFVLIMSMGMLISQLTLWPFIRRYIYLVKPNFIEIKKMIRPNLVLFIPVISISLYKQMDRIILGNFSTMTEVGFLENAIKLNSIPLTLVTAFSAVMLPKMSNMVAVGNSEGIEKYIQKSLQAVLFFSCAAAFGLAAIARDFAPLFFGEGFEKTGTLVVWLSPTIIFVAWANIIRTQYLIPCMRDKVYIISIIVGAILNVIFNLILIPRFGSIGVVPGTIIAEFSVALIQTWAVRKDLNIIRYMKDSLIFIISGIVMYMGIIIFSTHVNFNSMLMLILEIIVGAMIYLTLTGFYLIRIKKLNIKKLSV